MFFQPSVRQPRFEIRADQSRILYFVFPAPGPPFFKRRPSDFGMNFWKSDAENGTEILLPEFSELCFYVYYYKADANQTALYVSGKQNETLCVSEYFP